MATTDVSQRLANLSPAKRALLEERLKKSATVAEPIALVGMACRFPGAPDLESYWRLIRDCIDATGEIPSSRWDVDELYDPTGEQAGKMSVRWAGMIDRVDQFDPHFFGISPREASRMDPQQRLLLEVAWEALENAGLAPDRLSGTATGTFIGIGATDYSKIPAQFEDYYRFIDAHVGTGNALSIAANRLSYILDLRGPSVAVDTACSSGLIGVHLAVQSLRNRECDAALAGGVNLILTPETTIAFSKARMLSPDGKCRPFDAAANGYVRGEGCGVLVLKRLTDAVRDGDNVLAVLRASAANQDGRTSGITAPNEISQQAVIRAALAQAGLTLDRVSYIEAHGTGTPLGDPIEMEALKKLFRSRGPQDPPCFVTSVKANIGHTETVSGVAGVIKVALMMQHGLIPAQTHLTQLNPHISLEGTRLRVPTEPCEWRPASGPRIAGVSSFGFGGTNTHVILEEAAPPAVSAPQVERPLHVLTLSGKSAPAVEKLASRYAEFLEQHPEANLADVCHTANAGRAHFNHRAAVAAATRDELHDKLLAFAEGRSAPGAKSARVKLATLPKVAFLFTGQGSQYLGMGRRLYETQPTFRKALEQCGEILSELLDEPLLAVLYGGDADSSPIHETNYTQPALFSLEYALATLWRSWGVEPSIVLGHSVGEYVAAVVAGAVSLEDGLRLIAHRARLMQQLPHNGAMAVIFTSYERVAEATSGHEDRVSIAAANGPENTVLSGETETVRRLSREFEAAGVGVQPLTVSHAFHSPLMEPMLDEFRRIAAEVEFQRPRVPLVSNLTGQVLHNQTFDPDYLCRHIRSTVRFAESMQRVAEQGIQVMLEIGPTASLLGMGRRCLPKLEAAWLPSLRKGQEDWPVLLSSLSELYLLGAKLDWSGFDRDYPRRRPMLPTYPFERQRCWFDASGAIKRSLDGGPTRGPALHPLLGSRVPAALETTLFESRLSCHWPKYLIDHQVQGAPVTPAAAYVELALAAARQTFGEGSHVVENLAIQQPMFLPEGTTRLVQTAVSPERGGECALETYSAAASAGEGAPRWSLHVAANLRHGDSAPQEFPAPFDLDAIRRRPGRLITREEFYGELMKARQLVYGPAFQVFGVLHRYERESLGEVQLAPEVVQELGQHHLHPALGDALFQIMAGLTPLEPDGSFSPFTYMPVGVRRIRQHGELAGRMFIYGERTSSDQPSPETVEGNLYLLDDAGRVLLEMEGVRVQRVGRASGGARETDIRDWLYQVQWRPAPLPPASEQPQSKTTDGPWLIFADAAGVGERLAKDLHRAGARCALVRPAREFGVLAAENGDASVYRIDPLDGAHYRRLFKETLGADSPRCAGVIHLWSFDIGDPAATGEAALDDARRLGCGSVLQLIRETARFAFAAPPALWLATQNAVATDDSTAPVAVAQAPLWGLGRVAAMELTDFSCRLIDLDRADEVAAQAAQLLQELTAAGQDQQIARRRGERFVARLTETPDIVASGESASSAGAMSVPREGAFQLRLGKAGSFDSLRFEPFRRQSPDPGQVEIEVRATGLNFSDVLKAMGLYPGIKDEVVPLGIECSGVVTAVGEGVERFRVGDEVLGVAPYSFASHARTAEYALAPKPAHFDHAEAATIPVTFLTAYYALVRLAHLQPGERVLIHAGAGGVGLAAIQIAQQIGAEIFTTAGSEEKRAYLRSLGVQHVLNSRTLDFADQILEATQREGVDVVLNSLPGEAITRSLECLRAYGRFLEIGKTDIYQNRKIGLLPFQDNLSYFAIDLDRMLRQRPDYIRPMFAELMEHFQRGDYQPLAHTQFSTEQTIDAFRYMAARKNIGKVIVTLEPAESAPEQASGAASAAKALVRGDGAYLITGGLGALGLRVAEWLAERGAKHLALLARRAPGAQAATTLARLKSQGVEVAVLQGDVADRPSLNAALAQLPRSFPPLCGVMHAAGVLADGVLFDMDLAKFDIPLAPKVRGAWNLHDATRDAPLDFFVLFSSVACVLGSPGQGNYAAGNAFLDALAAYRRSQGLSALSINWGPWAESGMAAQAGRGEQIAGRGMGLLPPEPALEALERLLRAGQTNAAVMDADWNDLLRMMAGRRPSLLADLAVSPEDAPPAEEADAVDHAFRDELLRFDFPARQEKLRGYFASELGRIMGLNAAQLDIAQPLSELGMDSLLAMELKNNLERRLAFSLPMAAFLEGPSITTLAEHAAKALAPVAAAASSSSTSAETAPSGQAASRPARAWSPLVTFQAQGAKAPVFAIHPIGGDVSCYAELARRLGKERPVYAIRGRGSDGFTAPDDSLDAMASVYLDAIRRTQSTGPYHLLGWSAGGVFAYELARRLLAQGEPLGLVALIDTPLPSIYDNVDLADNARFLDDFVTFVNRFSAARLDISYDQLHALPLDQQLQLVLTEAKTKGVASKAMTEEHLRRLVETSRTHVKTIKACQIQPLGHRVHLYLPEQEGTLAELSKQTLADDLGWRAVLGDNLVLHRSPGEHFSMLTGDHAARLAEQISRQLS